VFERIEEAPLRETEAGLVPEGDGWFVVNVADGRGIRTDRFGAACVFEGAGRFPEFGVNVHVLQPGQPNSLYHREDAQEAFLVLSGEALAIVEDEERPLRAGDLLHTPPGTAHVLVGAGDRPCAILMVGTRKRPETLLYPVSEVAARYRASVKEETSDEGAAYAGTPPPEPGPIGMPW
jgi:uncharacterized cupin superfamily protein